MDDKSQSLRQFGVLHSHPEQVTDSLFRDSEFFDARDLLQVKYEMLRRVEVEEWTVTAATEAFGFSRPVFYQAQTAFQVDGLVGLIPQRPGPRRAHKLSDHVIDFLLEQQLRDPQLGSAALAELLARQFALQVHPRSIERALGRRLKKGL